MKNRNTKNLFSAPVVALATLGFITACGGGSGSGTTTNPVSDPATVTPTGADTLNPSPTPALNPPTESTVVDSDPAPNQIVTPSNNPDVTPLPTNLTNIQDVFNASPVAVAGDEIYLVVRNNQIFQFDYLGDSLDQGPDCFVIDGPLDDARLEYSPGFMQISGQSLPAVNATVLEKAGECSADSGNTPSTTPTNPSTVPTTTRDPRARSLIESHPRVQGARNSGDVFDFNNADAVTVRNTLSGRIVRTTGQFGVDFNTFTHDFVNAFCSDGSYVLAYKFTQEFINVDLLQNFNNVQINDIFLSGSDREIYKGYWDVARIDTTLEDGTRSQSTTMLSLVDLQDQLQASATQFPLTGQAPINVLAQGQDGTPIPLQLTDRQEALEANLEFWMGVKSVTPQGIIMDGSNEVTQTFPGADEICNRVPQ